MTELIRYRACSYCVLARISAIFMSMRDYSLLILLFILAAEVNQISFQHDASAGGDRRVEPKNGSDLNHN